MSERCNIFYAEIVRVLCSGDLGLGSIGLIFDLLGIEYLNDRMKLFFLKWYLVKNIAGTSLQHF
jgi:hypothetical protein